MPPPNLDALLASVGNLFSPASAEAEVRYSSPALERLDKQIQSGNVTDVRDVDPALLRYIQRIVKQAHGVKDVVEVGIAPLEKPTTVGLTEPGEKGEPTKITIAPWAWDELRLKALPHELGHFLLNRISQSYNDFSNTRQHIILDALLHKQADTDKEKLIHEGIKSNFPAEDEKGKWFKQYEADTLRMFRAIMEEEKAEPSQPPSAGGKKSQPMEVRTLSNEQWTQLLTMRREGKLTPAQDAKLQRDLNAGNVPQEVITGIDPSESTIGTPGPETPRIGEYQGFTEPTQQSWGQTAVELGIPLLAGIASGGNPAVIGGAAGAAHMLATSPLTPPDPTTHPLESAITKGNIQQAARIGLETGGAAAAGGLLAPAAEGAGILTRVGTEAARAGLSGAGAAAGSLAAEPVAPTEKPLEHAMDVGESTAVTQGVMSGALGFGKKLIAPFAKTLTEEGKAAAETLSERGLRVPIGEVSMSPALKTAEYLGKGSLGGGYAIARRTNAAEASMVGEINKVIDYAGRLPGGQVAADVYTPMYQQLDRVVGQQLTGANKPVFLDSAKPASTNVLLNLRGTPAAALDPAHAYPLAQVADDIIAKQARVGRPDTQALQRRLDQIEQLPGISGPVYQHLTTLRQALTTDTDSPAVIDTGQIRPRVNKFLQSAGQWLPADMHAVAARLENIPERMTVDEAKELRTSLLALGRAAESGGVMRAPSAGGQPSEPRTGGRFTNIVGGQARSLAGEVDQAMEDGLTRLGGGAATLWRHANEAYKVTQRQEWLTNMLEGTRDPVTGRYDGRKILDKLQDVKREESLPGLFPPETIAQVKQFANALSFTQDVGEARGHGALKEFLPSKSGALWHGAFATGMYTASHNPALALTAALTPTALGMVLQSPRLTRLLTIGYALPPHTKASVDALSRLAGVLRAEGLLGDVGGAPPTPETPQSPETPQ